MLYMLAFVAAVLVAICLCIYINPTPQVRQNEKTAWLKTTPVAHRGLHTNNQEVPENSLKAVQRAIAHGYAIEIDVQLSADGKVVVFHDYTLKRMTGAEGRVADLPWSELEKLPLLGSDQRIPSLRDVLALVKGQVPLLIEVKNEGSPGKLEEALIKELADYDGPLAVQAFNPLVLKYLRNKAPEIVRGQLSGSFRGEDLAWWKKFLLRYLLLNHLSCPSFVAYQTGAVPRWLATRLRKKGLYLLTWTVTSQEGCRRDLAIVDNIIFEGFAPDLTRAGRNG